MILVGYNLKEVVTKETGRDIIQAEEYPAPKIKVKGAESPKFPLWLYEYLNPSYLLYI